MAVSFSSTVGLNSMMQVSGSCSGTYMPKSVYILSTTSPFKSKHLLKHKHGRSRLIVAESNPITTTSAASGEGTSDSQKASPSFPDPSLQAGQTNIRTENNGSELPIPSPLTGSKPSSSNSGSVSKRAPLTAREKLRAARVMSRYSDTKGSNSKSGMGSKLLDALKESEKGKKGLPEAPTNMFDDGNRGLPKQGLTFSFPGGVDLFIIAFSFVFISTLMFATTYFVWKVGAIHFNEY